MTRVALVAGATGVVGNRLALHLAATTRWRVIGLSRHRPLHAGTASGIDFLQIDLQDRDACLALAKQLQGVTHLFNTARFDHDTVNLESPHTNTVMLANLLDGLETAGHPLQHVHIVQGTKYYGSHLGPFPTPARESDPRSLQDNFYYHQEDLLIARQHLSGWSWSASRPHAIVDPERMIARCIPVIIAVYATISKARGLPLCFPGTEENYRALYQFTDAGLLAAAIEWMAVEEKARNQAFNVANGDFTRWCTLWPQIASYFGMDVGPVRTVNLAEVMSDKAPIWRHIVDRHRLAPTRYEDAALWSYGDFVFKPGWDIMSSTMKARLLGFGACVDTRSMIFEMFDRLRQWRVVPAS